MYCYYNVLPEAIFVVYFTCKQHCLHKKIFSGDLPAMNICLHAKFQVRWCYGFGSTVLAVQLFNKIKKKKKKEKKKTTKNMKKQVSLYFRGVMLKYIYFW